MGEMRSKYLAVKTSLEAIPDPRVVVDYIRRPKTDGGLGQPDAAIVWANHPAECGGHPHTHYIVRFRDQTYWGDIRRKLKQLGDDHAYSDVGRSWSRSCRYLLHLDNPEKEPIPRDNLQYEGVEKSEIEMIMGAPRRCLLNDIRKAPTANPFGFVSWLVDERGHSPGEVASMIRCVLAAGEYVARMAELQSFQAGALPEETADDVSAACALPEGVAAAETIADDPFSGGGGFDSVGMPEGWA